MYIGEFLCIFVYNFKKKKFNEEIVNDKIKAEKEGKNMNFGKIIFIPSFLDYISTMCYYYGLLIVSKHIDYPNLACIIIIVTFMNHYYLKKKIY